MITQQTPISAKLAFLFCQYCIKQARDQNNMRNPPPPNQQLFPQSFYPPFPQSYWSTPPPGEGPPTSWSTGSGELAAGLTGTSGTTGMSGNSTENTGLTGYLQWSTEGVATQ